MDLPCATFALSPPGRDEKLVLVRATDAVRLCREGNYEALPQGQASLRLFGLGRRDMGGLRQFVARARLSRFPLSSLDDGELLALLGRSLRGQEVVALRESDDAGTTAGRASAEQRRLIREIAGKTRGRLDHAGRRYKLVADVDLARLSDRDSYEVVRHDDAAKILNVLANENRAAADLFAKAKQGLTRDWRPPLAPDGLILLRKITTMQAVAPSEVITPSQLKKMLAKTEWIEIVVTDDLGKPYTGPYRIQVPDGSMREGSFDEQGLWGDYDIDPGKCKLVLPDVPEAAKPGVLPPGDMTTWIGMRLVDDEDQPIVGQAYRLKLSAGPDRAGTTGDAEIRADGIAPGTCVFSLETEGAKVAPAR
jgi:hypothetical protein